MAYLKRLILPPHDALLCDLDRPDLLWRVGYGTRVRVGSPGQLRESWFAAEKIANQAGMNLILAGVL
jgi:hypothetical protein